MNKVLFIYNPNAGTGNKTKVTSFFKKYLQKKVDWDLVETKRPGHATEIVKENLIKYDSFYAIGGDGTVNEVGKSLINTDKVLGIIPAGSGNGLARELGCTKLDQFNGHISSTRLIDTFTVNEQTCLNVAGLGFDANVAHQFHK